MIYALAQEEQCYEMDDDQMSQEYLNNKRSKTQKRAQTRRRQLKRDKHDKH